MISKIIQKRFTWICVAVSFLTIQLYDQESYSRFVLRNTRQAITYEWVAWNANLNDEYDRDHIATPDKAPERKSKK